MSLEFVPHVRTGTGAVDLVTIEEHLYLTEERDRVVAEGDPAGRWLWAAPGRQVPRAEAERLGAIAPQRSSEPELAAEPETSEPKQRKASANKMRAKGEDK